MTTPLAGAPLEYALPATRPTLAEAQAWCRHLANTHYENFHVATWFLPKRVRPHFESIYAFARVSDDLGDEVADAATATRLLAEWRAMLAQCYAAPAASQHPVFVALRQTIAQTGVPQQLFDDLITAFEQDQVITRHPSLASLEHYSVYSANPVGRLVLWVSGYHDETRAKLSDKICTALQLANFWQDVVEDHSRQRRYLPADIMQRFGVADADLANRTCTPAFRQMMAFLVGYTRAMMDDGARLADTVDPELAVTLRLFIAGGRAALQGVADAGFNVLARRPSVSKATKLRLLTGALAGKAASLFAPAIAPPIDARERAVQEAYSFCREVARREAKNFYYSFKVLPQAKSDSMCAVYAFMRHADDLADDESQPLAERRQAMAAFLASWREARANGSTANPVFLALTDTQARFGIDDALLEQLVQGVTMDLEAEQPGTVTLTTEQRTEVQGYKTFADLYRYCYLVASVVGLVTIKIFGYTDPRAELLAEKTGIAFQLTNILRDVKEDAARHRIYIPQDMLAHFHVSNQDLLAAAAGLPIAPQTRALIAALAAGAQDFYRAAQQLIPLIDPDSRPALWVLVGIYNRLLRQIDARHGDVFSRRASVPSYQKAWVLTRGAAQTISPKR